MPARFGLALRDRRRQLGLNIQQVANVIKMKPQILEYIEEGDFYSMPPRGYAQGMISAYANYLGLDPRAIIDMYFDDLAAYEADQDASRARFDAGVANPVTRGHDLSRTRVMGSSRNETSMPDNLGRPGTYYPPETQSSVSKRALALTGSRFAQRPPQAGYVPEGRSSHMRGSAEENRNMVHISQDQAVSRRSDYYSQRTQQMRRPLGVDAGPDLESDRYYRQGGATPIPMQNRGRSQNNMRGQGVDLGRSSQRRPQRSSQRSSQRSNSLPLKHNNLQIDPRFIYIAFAVVCVLVLVAGFFAFTSCTAKPEDSKPNNQVQVIDNQTSDSSTSNGSEDNASASNDGTDTQGSASANDNSADQSTTDEPQEELPTEGKVEVIISEGASPFVEIKTDGTTPFANNITGPETKTYTISDTFELTTDDPSSVKVVINGKEIKYDSQQSGIGRISFTLPKPEPKDDAQEGSNSSDGNTSQTAVIRWYGLL